MAQFWRAIVVVAVAAVAAVDVAPLTREMKTK